MNLVLIGEESAGIQILRALAKTGHRIVAVIASPSRKSTSGATLWNAAEATGYPTWPTKLVKDRTFAKRLRIEQVDIILNVHSLSIIHPDVLEAARIGAFNMHPGPLPRYAGLNPVSWALYRGEHTHGVTIHKMVAEIDAGPIAYQSLFPIEESDTALSLNAKCVRAGIGLMVRLIETAARNPADIPLAPQDLAQREYFGPGIPEEGRLSWLWSAHEIVNFVRACDYFPFPSPWGHPLARIANQEIAIVKASRTGVRATELPGTMGQPCGSGICVACVDEWILLSKVQLDGRYHAAVDILRPGVQLHHQGAYIRNEESAHVRDNHASEPDRGAIRGKAES